MPPRTKGLYKPGEPVLVKLEPRQQEQNSLWDFVCHFLFYFSTMIDKELLSD